MKCGVLGIFLVVSALVLLGSCSSSHKSREDKREKHKSKQDKREMLKHIQDKWDKHKCNQGKGDKSKHDDPLTDDRQTTTPAAAATTTTTTATTTTTIPTQSKTTTPPAKTTIETTSTVTEPQNMTTTVTMETNTTAEPTVQPEFRLPTNFSPTLYIIELQPNIYSGNESDFDFDGSCSIVVRCNADTDVITLHMSGLNLTGGIIVTTKEDADDINDDLYESHSLDERVDFLKIKTTTMLKAGRDYTLMFRNYKGVLGRAPWGLYYTSYKEGNETKYLAASQMQVANARKVFPGFDEPAMKAKFFIRINRKTHMKSLSNMPIQRSFTRTNNWVQDIYQLTPTMSTYLLAFVVCDFQYIEKTTTNNVKVRVWSRKEALSGTAFALDVGVRVLTYFENYFNITYQLPKLDMIAIQNLYFGGMENWGLITYRENALLYEKGVSSPRDQLYVAKVVAHELSHMWFGNLVSPAWWDDLWLNEGFAKYMEYVGLASVQPEWRMFDFFATDVFETALRSDSYVTSHPVYVDVQNPDEILAIFDSISYNKGASLVKMMNSFLGESTFRRGLEFYLNKLEFGNARKDDLWYALGNQSKSDGNKIVDVKSIMDTWTTQMNYPMVQIDYTNDNVITVSQSRYIEASEYEDPQTYKSPYNYRWKIPFTYTTSKEVNFNQNPSDVELVVGHHTYRNVTRIPAVQSDSWVIGNVNGAGFYRVNYDKRNWQALTKQLLSNSKVIGVTNRAQLISDSWSFVRAGKLDLRVALDIVSYIQREFDLTARIAFDISMNQPRQMLRTTSAYQELQKFLWNGVAQVYGLYGLKDTGAKFLDSYNAEHVSNYACGDDFPNCVNGANILYRQWMKDGVNNIPQALRTAVYCTAVRHGGTAEWGFAFRQMQVENVKAERHKLLRAITCTTKAPLLARVMESMLNSSVIEEVDILRTAVYLSFNHAATCGIWDFTRIHYVEMVNRVGKFRMVLLVQYLAYTFNNELRLKEVKAFGEEHGLADIRDFQKAIEYIENNISWMEKHYDTFKAWLEKFETSQDE